MTRDGKTGLRAAKQPKPESTFDDHTSTRQSALRVIMGLHNNEDMFLDETRAFLKHYVRSQIAEDQITACIEGMLNDPQALIEKTSDDSLAFKAFSDRLTSSAHFGRIVEQIIEHNPGHPPAALHVRLCPAHWVTSNVEKGMYKIDACFTEIAQQNEIANHHIMLPIVLAQDKTDKSRIEVHQHILGACHHILNEDMRRMWIFGITVEDSLISLWYFSRSHSVKTFAADWLKDPRLLVQIILTFANTDYCSLGIDPSVHIGAMSGDGKTLSYVYEVPSEVGGGSPTFYKTGQIRSPTPSLNIAGRGTKVWEVTQVTSASGEIETNPVKKAILKDVWVDKDQPTEGKNMDSLFDAVDSFLSIGLDAQIHKHILRNPHLTRDAILSNPRTVRKLTTRFINKDKRFKAFEDSSKGRLVENLLNQNYRSLFLSKVCEWKGELSIDLRRQAQRCETLFQSDPFIREWMGAEPAAKRATTIPDIESRPAPIPHPENQSALEQTEDSDGQFVQKQQFRIIYNEVCQSLYDLPTLGDVFDVLCEAIDACHILFCAGWVHRDISAGNILALKTDPNQPWKVRLADLEFARPMIQDKRAIRSNPWAGTTFFMPTEILDGSYLLSRYYSPNAAKRVNIDSFFPEVLPENSPSADDDDDSDDSDSDVSSSSDDSGAEVSTAALLLRSLATQFSLKPIDAQYSVLDDYIFVPFLPAPAKLPQNAKVGTIDPHSHLVNHNFQHDLESIWWIAVWFITSNVKCKASSDWAKPFFPHHVEDSTYRTMQFVGASFGMGFRLRAELQTHFPKAMEYLRCHMNREYIMREICGYLELPESYSQIHNLFANTFRGLVNTGGDWRSLELSMEHDPVEAVQLEGPNPSPATAGTKRGRDESDGESRESTQGEGSSKKQKGNDN